MSFGRWLKDRRRALDLTQESLAEAVGCSVDTIRKVEAGIRRPSRQIADLLAVSLDIEPPQRATFTAWARGSESAATAFEPAAAPADPPAASTPEPAKETAPADVPARPAPPQPRPLTPRIGRGPGQAQARALLWRVGVRLVTLTGPGGTGKTRLALELAATLASDFPDGVYFVALAPIQDPDLIPTAIAAALEIPETPGQSLTATIQATLRHKALLLVLDNFEHLVEAAPLVVDLLEAAPGLKVLSTSRARLRLRGEKEYPVPPLSLPPVPDEPAGLDLAQYPAVTLFLERAADAGPGFPPTPANLAVAAAICRRLDGLPLAIELAAARCRSLAPSALLAQLNAATPAPALHLLTGGYRDLPARQQTLRDTIAWSYQLLPPAQQRLFRRLAVFVGGACAPAARAVAGAPDSDTTAEATYLAAMDENLAALVEGNLLLASSGPDPDGRYTMLATIREYALECLTAAGERETLEARHSEYFLAQAEAGHAELRGPAQATWFAYWETEHDNLRVLLGRALARQDALTMLRAGAALWRFWYARGHVGEGRRWLEAALALPATGAPLPSLLRAHGLRALGTLATVHSDYAQAAAYLHESLDLYRAAGDTKGQANVLNNLGTLAHHQGEYAQARAALEEGLAAFRALGDGEATADVLSNLASVLKEMGDYAAATAAQEESLALRRARGDSWGVAASLNNLADVAQEQGHLGRARVLYEESLSLFRAVGERMGTAVTLNNLGNVALSEDDLPRARALQAESLAAFGELGDKRGLVWCLDSLAAIAAATGDWPAAVRLIGAATANRAALGVPATAPEPAAYDRHLAGARAALAPAAVALAWADGEHLTLDQACAAARDLVALV
jgi:predicted ATPase/transcriptional regulator with XRE-family HTH domain